MIKLEGDNATVPGQIKVGTQPSEDDHVPRNDDKRFRYLGTASVTECDFGSTGDLPQLTGLPDKWIPWRVVVVNATADLSAATLGIYTLSGGGGEEVMAPTLLSDLTGVNGIGFIDITPTGLFTSTNDVYPRLTVASGNPGTADIILFYHDLSEIIDD